MRRLAVVMLLVLIPLVGAGLMTWWFWPAPPIVSSLRSLREVGRVDYTGPAEASLVVIHLRDWHFVPRDLCALDGIDFDENLAAVERVQADELAIARHLTAEHGLKDIYSEGLTDRTMPDLQLRLGVLADLDKLAELGGLDDAARRHRRELVLEVGIPGRLLRAGEVEKVLPLEDDAALRGARPVVKGGAVRLDAARVEARRAAMVRRLPASGLVLVVLGGSHDLGPYLGEDVLYVRVILQSYPGE